MEDVAINFSQEWALLDETQRLVQHNVMLENCALTVSMAQRQGDTSMFQVLSPSSG